MVLERDGNVDGSRWCAGCHDPVPLFSRRVRRGPTSTPISDPTAQAGITCTACHAIEHVNSTRGNADYTIEEPRHYPFAFSDNPALRGSNHQLVKAKPEFHKQTFLKPLHRTAEFCSTCHKVHIPGALNHYKEFLRGQNHYDTFLLSGVSGHGARSFYYPPQGRGRLRRLPHAARTPRATSARSTSTPAARCRSTTTSSPPPTPALPHLRGDRRDGEGAAGLPRQGGPRRPLRPARGRHDRRPADRPARRRRRRR